MARRSRTRERGVRVFLSIGDSIRAERQPSLTTRLRVLRPQAAAYSRGGNISDFVRNRPRVRISRRLMQSLSSKPSRSMLRARYPRFSSPRIPARLSVCVARRVRKEVMFAKAVAGRSWGSGGPQMRGARRTPDSSFTCRR